MKIGYISDIHFDMGTRLHQLDIFTTYVDVLIIAGDLGYTNHILAVLEDIHSVVGMSGTQIIFIPGNHDYYDAHRTIEQQNDFLKNKFKDFDSIHILVNGDSLTIHDTTFIGATLWSDLGNKISPLINMASVKRVLSDINDCCYINNGKFSPNDMMKQFDIDYAGIENSLTTSITNKNVVITHFSPTLMARNKFYQIDSLAYYFSATAESLINKHQPDIWIYGHTHDTNDNLILGDTIITSNQTFGNVYHTLKILEV